jgi:hypothetical protein
MALSFARLWKNEEHSDVDVVLKVTSHSGDETAAQQLSHFPGHSVLLSSSPMISAQVSSLGIRKHSQLLQLCVCKPLQCMCLGVRSLPFRAVSQWCCPSTLTSLCCHHEYMYPHLTLGGVHRCLVCTRHCVSNASMPFPNIGR